MGNRPSLLTIARAIALLAAISAGACTHASARLAVDVPRLLPFQAPDIDDITGIDSDEVEAKDGASAGSAQPAHK
jgi:hypothetical protein